MPDEKTDAPPPIARAIVAAICMMAGLRNPTPPQERTMDARKDYAGTEGKTRHDTFASSVVLAAIVASALAGVFVAGADSTVALAGDPVRYAAADEVRP